MAEEDAVCKNRAQKASAYEYGGAEWGGFLVSVDVIVEFWRHLVTVLFSFVSWLCMWKLVIRT